eukprot:PhM_4_TR18089/c0_g1_i1/m.106268
MRGADCCAAKCIRRSDTTRSVVSGIVSASVWATRWMFGISLLFKSNSWAASSLRSCRTRAALFSSKRNRTWDSFPVVSSTKMIDTTATVAGRRSVRRTCCSGADSRTCRATRSVLSTTSPCSSTIATSSSCCFCASLISASHMQSLRSLSNTACSSALHRNRNSTSSVLLYTHVTMTLMGFPTGTAALHRDSLRGGSELPCCERISHNARSVTTRTTSPAGDMNSTTASVLWSSFSFSAISLQRRSTSSGSSSANSNGISTVAPLAPHTATFTVFDRAAFLLSLSSADAASRRSTTTCSIVCVAAAASKRRDSSSLPLILVSSPSPPTACRTRLEASAGSRLSSEQHVSTKVSNWSSPGTLRNEKTSSSSSWPRSYTPTDMIVVCRRVARRKNNVTGEHDLAASTSSSRTWLSAVSGMAPSPSCTIKAKSGVSLISSSSMHDTRRSSKSEGCDGLNLYTNSTWSDARLTWMVADSVVERTRDMRTIFMARISVRTSRS